MNMKIQVDNRRDFIKTTAMAAGAILMPGILQGNYPGKVIGKEMEQLNLLHLKKPLAIAMWDYSWILRHHRYGEFENWDLVLEELAERGYNAIRIDVMPQYVAADCEGKLQDEFRAVRNGWSPPLWGNKYTMSFRPREALLEFLPKCKKYGIKVGLATWFIRHSQEREDIFNDKDGLYRAWDETLSFLESHNLFDNVIYIDLLNEYPFWHGYDWLKNELNKRSDINQFKLDNPDANLPDINVLENNSNVLKENFYNEYISSLIRKLRDRHPHLDFFASIDSGMNLNKIDLSEFGALDYHVWFNHKGDIPGINEIRSKDQSLDLRKSYADLLKYWEVNKTSLIEWMDGRISAISGSAEKNNIACGNTEGWGPIFWYDHPELDWLWVKESANICVDLARKHDNYKFICTSNFTHPQFKGIWEDVKWHRQITQKIKNG